MGSEGTAGHEAPQLRLLLVEDDEADALLVQRELRRGGFDLRCTRVEAADALRAQLAAATWDLIITDWSLPGFDGLGVCRLVRDLGIDIPVIIVSGTVDEAVAVGALQNGARDFVTKGRWTRLLPAVHRELEAARRRRQALELERALFEGSTEPLLVVGTSGRIQRCNSALLRLLGYPAETLVGAPLGRILPLDLGDGAGGEPSSDAAQLVALLGQIKPGEQTGEEWIARHVDGSAIPVELSMHPIRVADDVALVVNLRDVTERRRAEAALRESESRFRSLAHSMDDLAYVVDRDGRVLAAHGQWLRREQIDPEQLLGARLSESFPSPDGNVHADAQAAAFRGERKRYAWAWQDDERRRTFETTLAPMRDGNTRVTTLVGVCRETTEERALQEQLLVSDRMASIGLLAAGVAHEINNPLGVTLGNLEFAAEDIEALIEACGSADDPGRRRELGDEILRELQEAREGAERVRVIVRDLRLFSRAHDPDRMASVDLVEVLESSLRMARNEVRHRAHVEREFGPTPAVMGNESRIGQVFLNLIVNAAQALPVGNVGKQTIRLVAGTSADGRALIEVHDNGVGMSDEVRRRIFTPFFTTKAPGVGTGLGLAICKRIVESMGGQIELDSRLGEGSTVRVLLPPTDGAVQSWDMWTPTQPHRTTERGRILVVDDEPALCALIKRALGAELDVDTVYSAHDALHRIDSGERYDVILCDVVMPEITGIELHRRLSVEAPSQGERVVFISGGVLTLEMRSYLDGCGNGLLTKPLEFDKLRQTIRDMLMTATELGI